MLAIRAFCVFTAIIFCMRRTFSTSSTWYNTRDLDEIRAILHGGMPYRARYIPNRAFTARDIEFLRSRAKNAPPVAQFSRVIIARHIASLHVQTHARSYCPASPRTASRTVGELTHAPPGEPVAWNNNRYISTGIN